MLSPRLLYPLRKLHPKHNKDIFFLPMIVPSEERSEKITQCCGNHMGILIWIPSYYFFLHCVHHWMAEDSAHSLSERLRKLHKAAPPGPALLAKLLWQTSFTQ